MSAIEHTQPRPQTRSVDANLQAGDLARMVLRVSLGFLLLLHGIGKLNGGLAFVEQSLAQAGLPTFLAYGVLVGEIVAPLLLIFGWLTRAAAWVVVVNMLVAVALVHTAQLGTLAPSGGWALELQALYLVVALAVAALGAGGYSLAARGSRWN